MDWVIAIGALLVKLGGMAYDAATASAEKKAQMLAEAQADFDACVKQLLGLEGDFDTRNAEMLKSARTKDAIAAAASAPVEGGGGGQG
jgi:hypothetical protein